MASTNTNPEGTSRGEGRHASTKPPTNVRRADGQVHTRAPGADRILDRRARQESNLIRGKELDEVATRLAIRRLNNQNRRIGRRLEKVEAGTIEILRLLKDREGGIETINTNTLDSLGGTKEALRGIQQFRRDNQIAWGEIEQLTREGKYSNNTQGRKGKTYPSSTIMHHGIKAEVVDVVTPEAMGREEVQRGRRSGGPDTGEAREREPSSTGMQKGIQYPNWLLGCVDRRTQTGICRQHRFDSHCEPKRQQYQ